MFPRRDNEPSYAILRNSKTQTTNQYGGAINTTINNAKLENQSFVINHEEQPHKNPDRYKQHGFYFNADNCIACHACESACSEKNDVPSHLAFRSVGFVEGGTYPAYQRLNISMACNHCDDPVCLKGCPTRAYTKFAEYGAVLQDPDICFGCGYCTWVCPYNAPQLDPVKGEVSKCNMCVDRLEVGLKPACVAACLGNALDFGVIEDIPDNRTQSKVSIPGFPDTSITKPNIRFEQKSSPHRDMNRVDSTALKYHKEGNNGEFKPKLDAKHGFKRFFNIKALFGSHENAHIAFTLTTQAVIGAFLLILLMPFIDRFSLSTSTLNIVLPILVLISGTGLFKLNMHLGKPHRFYRGFYNLKWSPVSREIAGVSLFFMGLVGYSVLHFFNDIAIFALLQNIMAVIGALGALFGGYYMIQLYRIPARPFWNHWHTDASFIATALTMGSSLIALASLVTGSNANLPLLSMFFAAGLIFEVAALLAHRKKCMNSPSEGAASYYEQQTTYGYAFVLRNILLPLLFALTVLSNTFNELSHIIWPAMMTLSVASTIISRALFYVVVIPTTMPGAFFWKNEGFVDHARESGLADMPQMGVAYERHHKFKMYELIDTILNTSLKDKISQTIRIFTG